jgi:hypothetical protein
MQENLPVDPAFGVAKIALAYHSLSSGELDFRVECTILTLEATDIR